MGRIPCVKVINVNNAYFLSASPPFLFPSLLSLPIQSPFFFLFFFWHTLMAHHIYIMNWHLKVTVIGSQLLQRAGFLLGSPFRCTLGKYFKEMHCKSAY